MANVYGAIVAADYSDQYINTIGQQFVYANTLDYLNRYNADLEAAMSVFVEGNTDGYSEQYRMLGSGRLQRRGINARVGATKATEGWTVQYPLEDFGGRVSTTDVDLAYMSGAEYNRHVESIIVADRNTVRFEILKALFNNTARTFVDPRWGSLSVKPLANGDTVTYPPVEGSETSGTEDHYLESGYAASAISDTNNPVYTLVNELEEHFGTMTGGDNAAVFINNAQTAKIQALTDFDEVNDRFIRVGDNTDVPINLPSVPGRIIGRSNGAWVIEWRWIPANYMLAVHLDAPAPLKMRVDPAATGLGTGLQLVALDAMYPFRDAEWRHRFGVGVGNRLNGVVMELGTGGTYSIPSAYA